MTGNVRYTAPEADERAKLEAQVAIQNLNLDQLPRVSSVFEATQNMDVGFILDARGVTAGNGPGNGRIGARILSDGPALLVESLDIVNLAGANAKVSGRIAPDGSGRIAGKVTAERAAPLVDLMGSVWIGGLSKLVPPFLRDGELDLDVVTERVAATTGLVRNALAHDSARHRGGRRLRRAGGFPRRTHGKARRHASPPTIPAAGSNEPTCPSLNRPSQSRPARHPRGFGAVQRHARRRMSAA